MKILMKITEHVSENPGSWPATWEDIGETESAERFADLNFNSSLNELHQQKGSVRQAIKPAHGRFLFYSHSEVLYTELQVAIRESELRSDLDKLADRASSSGPVTAGDALKIAELVCLLKGWHFRHPFTFKEGNNWEVSTGGFSFGGGNAKIVIDGKTGKVLSTDFHP